MTLFPTLGLLAPVLRAGPLASAAMPRARISEETVNEQIRSSGAARIEDVAAVVLETTGDISIMTKPAGPKLMQGVRGG